MIWAPWLAACEVGAAEAQLAAGDGEVDPGAAQQVDAAARRRRTRR